MLLNHARVNCRAREEGISAVASSFTVINSQQFIGGGHAFQPGVVLPLDARRSVFPHLLSEQVYRAARIARSRTSAEAS